MVFFVFTSIFIPVSSSLGTSRSTTTTLFWRGRTPLPLVVSVISIVVTWTSVVVYILIGFLCLWWIRSLLHDKVLSFLWKLLSPMLVPQFSNWVAEVYFDSPFVNECSVHFAVGKYACVFCFEFDESVLQRVACFPIPNNLTGHYPTKSRKDNLKVVRLRYWIQLAHEQYVFWWLDVCLGQII